MNSAERHHVDLKMAGGRKENIQDPKDLYCRS